MNQIKYFTIDIAPNASTASVTDPFINDNSSIKIIFNNTDASVKTASQAGNTLSIQLNPISSAYKARIEVSNIDEFEVQNNLTSTDIDDALSASQGKALKEQIDAVGDDIEEIEGILQNAEDQHYLADNLITELEQGSFGTHGEDVDNDRALRQPGFISVTPGQKYTISALGSEYLETSLATFNGDTYVGFIDWKSLPYVFTAPSNVNKIRLQLYAPRVTQFAPSDLTYAIMVKGEVPVPSNYDLLRSLDYKQDNLPEGILGRYLKYGSTGIMWSELNELPVVSTSSYDKYLHVDNDGDLEWSEAGGGGGGWALTPQSGLVARGGGDAATTYTYTVEHIGVYYMSLAYTLSDKSWNFKINGNVIQGYGGLQTGPWALCGPFLCNPGTVLSVAGSYCSIVEVTNVDVSGGEWRTPAPDYSTAEQLTGQKWIDGKDVYKIVVPTTIGTITTSWKTVSLGFTIDTIISACATTHSNASWGTRVYYPVVAPGTNKVDVRYYEEQGVDYLILEYTKS